MKRFWPGRGVATLCVLALVLTGAAAWGAGQWRSDTRPGVTAAADAVPRSTVTWNYTDWAAIRDAVGRRDGGSGFALAADERDLSTRSVLGVAAGPLQRLLGWSLADLAWESYAATRRGEVVVLRLGDGLSVDRVRSSLRSADYRRTGDGDEVWALDAATVRAAELPELAARIRVLARQRLLVLGESGPSDLAADVVSGRSPSLLADRDAAPTVQALSGKASILLQRATDACAAASVAGVDAAQVRTALERSGPLRRYVVAGRGLADDGAGASGGGSGFAQDATLAMTFASGRTARQQAVVRERLTSGAYLGRSGRYEDSMRDVTAGSESRTATLDFRRRVDGEPFMTADGPTLFAACPS